MESKEIKKAEVIEDIKSLRFRDIESDPNKLLKTIGFNNTEAATSVLMSSLTTILKPTAKDNEDIEKGDHGVLDKLEKRADEILALLTSLAPRDPFENLLANQMIITFRTALDTLDIANKQSNSDIYVKYQNQGIKLMRLYTQQLETLDKHRRKGSQKMTVEHVHVHEGGRAIVGTVTQGGVRGKQ